jgi:hypothetical protein
MPPEGWSLASQAPRIFFIFAGATFHWIIKKSFGKQKWGVFVTRYENKLVSETKKGCFCAPNVIE